MTKLVNLLARSFVRTFYEANIGFFLVMFYLAFGLMRSTEHIAIATAIAGSWSLTLLTLLLWLAYGFKTNAFVFKQLQTKRYRLLRDLAFYPDNMQWAALLAVHLMVLAPIWAYGVFIGYFAVLQTHYLHLLALIGFLTVLTLASSLATIQRVKHPVREAQPGLWYRWVSKRWALPRFLWYIRHSFVHEPLPAFFAKLGALLVLSGTFYLYRSDTYDWRLLAVGTLFAFAFNTMLVYGHYDFNRQNDWTLQMPLRRSAVFLTTLATWSTLFVPEMVVIAYNSASSISLGTLLNLCLFLVALAIFWMGMLTRYALNREDYGKRSFYLVLVVVVVLMYAVPLLVTNSLLIALGGWGMSGIYLLKTNS